MIERSSETDAIDLEAPLYENHWPSAQRVWEQLHDKHLLKEITRQEPDGRQLHVELGKAGGSGSICIARIPLINARWSLSNQLAHHAGVSIEQIANDASD